ncbi:FtsW/RodA/SpoVE family cell cycle protein [Lentilactobacillus hilgardii]|uniref:Probable peptidoglycan glycosyltransferase FtsW n=1 Tax=Lentilactobacillus hilgardii (strain ATCC 8290 / DSM 20176 / CCUG 30140 / JCM 1155 / KCTC 3500 / NBRC 15886 / NCIMB 8040 / NRRL B-1843 / 9) TaxID=1423757 RepID=C0XKP6_LENH9|nr:FtsW/RodA/SpoVE family cell cycle protein [Lentilactobacillus hilgardii]EEI19878.1 putative cell division protein FtsW [Lentilactobacillus buchneri ATCC 11577]EEI24041.1 putative cell division protein FtsW [Lentilactobacillus hilgardii DSM 20176 = ATCC 8290]MCT3396763.1 FtsW/RodA/SpoVE family cell cycle protein [Lentilactobacillus hilgardii]QEU38262.1 FtsW/RodA/SpoVE family cell cycle protein [Lentilactobacillus hilgardii]QIR09046.1 putative peptidoglycan glycosyltransferase FtsW [Lentilact
MAKVRLRHLDLFIFLPYIILCVLGIIMVYSASANIGIQNGGSPKSYLIKQIIFVVISLVLVFGTTAFNLKKIRNKKFLRWLGYCFILVLIGLLAVGQTVNGAAGWIHIGGINIQPAEFAKFYLIILVADAVDRDENELTISTSHWWQALRHPLLIVAVMLILIFFQPDVGGAAINFAIVFIMLIASGFSWKRGVTYLVGFGITAYAFMMVVLVPLSESGKIQSYQLSRITAFVNPFKHATGVGQQLVNSFYAISNGGLFGSGLGNSIQKTGYLPEPNTDFIMAILTEELGALATVAVMAILALIIFRTVLIGIRCNSTYHSLICYGVAAYLTVQALFNMGGVVGLLPITGVTFPFISYGGSSMMTLSLCIGIVLNISGRQRLERSDYQAATN